jgi:hypothetical protein
MARLFFFFFLLFFGVQTRRAGILCGRVQASAVHCNNNGGGEINADGRLRKKAAANSCWVRRNLARLFGPLLMSRRERKTCGVHWEGEKKKMNGHIHDAVHKRAGTLEWHGKKFKVTRHRAHNFFLPRPNPTGRDLKDREGDTGWPSSHPQTGATRSDSRPPSQSRKIIKFKKKGNMDRTIRRQIWNCNASDYAERWQLGFSSV